ncbi:MAG: nucleotidyltransferase family protein [Candidatus Cryptobacteroides sp.]
MDNVTQAFFSLLRCGLWGREPENPEIFDIDATGWEKIYRESRRQTVTGIVFRGLSFIPETFLPDDRLMSRWAADVFRIEQASARMDKVVAKVAGKFQELGLHPVLLKGQAVAGLYPEPALRESGDIDLYFADEGEWNEAVGNVRKAGKDVRMSADGSCHYEFEGIVVELHREMIDICNPFKHKWLKVLETEFGLASEVVGGCRVATPSPELNMLLMSSHIMKHAFGRGVGLRQVCDAALNMMRLEYPAERLQDLVSEAGLLKWNRLLNSFLVDYLGFPEEKLPYPDRTILPDSLLGIILAGGNFGRDAIRDASGPLVVKKMNTLKACLRHIPFALRYAPSEAVWSMLTLAAGQFRRI